MPIIELTFFNPLNVSVQVGDVAYYCNPTNVGPQVEWAGTSTPHRTCRQEDIIKIGTIISLQQWNGFNSSIIADMPQAIFNAYGPPTGGICGPVFDNESNCYNSISIDPQYYVNCDHSGGDMSPATGIPCVYGETFSTGTYPNSDVVSPLRWFFDDPARQQYNFSDYVFMNIFTGQYERITMFTPGAWTTWYTQYGYDTAMFNSVAEMIQFVIDDIDNGGVATQNCNQPSSYYYVGMTWEEWTTSCLGNSYGPGMMQHVETCGGVLPQPPCIGCSFIMFSKDNKVNLNSILGYYASVELRNNSTEEAEIFNVGARFFESSK
jgi:hypothetical protein